LYAWRQRHQRLLSASCFVLRRQCDSAARRLLPARRLVLLREQERMLFYYVQQLLREHELVLPSRPHML
jgi:hypothetical protein